MVIQQYIYRSYPVKTLFSILQNSAIRDYFAGVKLKRKSTLFIIYVSRLVSRKFEISQSTPRQKYSLSSTGLYVKSQFGLTHVSTPFRFRIWRFFYSVSANLVVRNYPSNSEMTHQLHLPLFSAASFFFLLYSLSLSLSPLVSFLAPSVSNHYYCTSALYFHTSKEKRLYVVECLDTKDLLFENCAFWQNSNSSFLIMFGIFRFDIRIRDMTQKIKIKFRPLKLFYSSRDDMFEISLQRILRSKAGPLTKYFTILEPENI